MKKVDRLLEVLDRENWSSDVKAKWNPPDGLFAKGSSKEIAKVVLKGHYNDSGKSISAINFYINRAGTNLDKKQVQILRKAIDILGA